MPCFPWSSQTNSQVYRQIYVYVCVCKVQLSAICAGQKNNSIKSTFANARPKSEKTLAWEPSVSITLAACHLLLSLSLSCHLLLRQRIIEINFNSNLKSRKTQLQMEIKVQRLVEPFCRFQDMKHTQN